MGQDVSWARRQWGPRRSCGAGRYWAISLGQNVVGQDVVGQDVTGAKFLGQNVVGQEVSGAERRGAERRGAGRHWGNIAISLGQDVVGQDVGGAGRRGAELRGAGRHWGKISGAGGHGAEGSGAGSGSPAHHLSHVETKIYFLAAGQATSGKYESTTAVHKANLILSIPYQKLHEKDQN